MLKPVKVWDLGGMPLVFRFKVAGFGVLRFGFQIFLIGIFLQNSDLALKLHGLRKPCFLSWPYGSEVSGLLAWFG